MKNIKHTPVKRNEGKAPALGGLTLLQPSQHDKCCSTKALAATMLMDRTLCDFRCPSHANYSTITIIWYFPKLGGPIIDPVIL